LEKSKMLFFYMLLHLFVCSRLFFFIPISVESIHLSHSL
jgi:hypothetical protein